MNLNLKPLIIALATVILFQTTYSHTRTCKTQLIRSFTLHSRITPNRVNSVCPKVNLNCCTSHDQMRMHKIWTTHGAPHVTTTHTKNNDSFTKLRAVMAFKDRIKATDIFEAFEKFGKPRPSTKTIRHLDDIVQKYKKIEGPALIEKMKVLPKKLAKFHHEVKHLRKGFLCSLCEWHNHRYVNTESMTLTYSVPFCLNIVQKYLDILAEKYIEIVNFLLTLDEFFYIITDQRLMESSLDRAIFRRYILIIEKCKENPGKIKDCAELCRQFNLNRFTYMFDGEDTVYTKFIKRFLDIVDALTGDKEDFLKLFAMKKKNWSEKQFKKFRNSHSVLSKKIIKDPTIKKVKKNSFDLEFKSQAIKTFVERKHPLSSIQIETLDDELSSITLYKLADKPVDISKFMIIFDAHGGLNLFKDSKKLNLDISKEHMIALIHAGGNDASSLSEVLDDSIKQMLNQLKITDLADFLTDQRIEFKKMAKKNPALDVLKPAGGGGKPATKPSGKPGSKPSGKPGSPATGGQGGSNSGGEKSSTPTTNTSSGGETSSQKSSMIITALGVLTLFLAV